MLGLLFWSLGSPKDKLLAMTSQFRSSSCVKLDQRSAQMKGKKFTEEQIIKVLKQSESGVPVKELCRQHGVTIQTIYRWKAKFGGMEVSDAKKLRALEDENRRLKKLVADQALDIQILKDVNSKKW